MPPERCVCATILVSSERAYTNRIQRTAARLIEENLQQRFSKRRLLQLTTIDMEQYSSSSITNYSDDWLTPTRYNFTEIKQDIQRYITARTDVIVLYGYYALYDKEIREMGTVKVFIDSDPDVRLTRWIMRDVTEPIKSNPELRAKEAKMLEALLKYYLDFARVEMNEFIFPTKQYSDVILPRGPEESGISLIGDGLYPLIQLNDSGEFGDSDSSQRSPTFSRSDTTTSMVALSNSYDGQGRFIDAS
ncbi:unnamed protein product [Kuraishia capsulata CBS 1993]|uniref:Phosphoribulokinase/uridine kinase domain-containing protein n=1 Tax=Kuraishia capsulata CBS 1993 TaxID=1382522 RepID=W6MQI6_9ASCO|nr:uncharacterized protein KUCA_T00003500001 [Kuraishia capsulata CBS 1993]CDK27522.1 unnamed protein product [Kuraishia capsulata CBS 1993]